MKCMKKRNGNIKQTSLVEGSFGTDVVEALRNMAQLLVRFGG
jgi:hypothetical protein